MDLPVVQARCDDLLMGIGVIQDNRAVTHLPQSMRDVLVQGIQNCLADVCDAAWDYYSTEEIPITDQTFPLLRKVVSYHLNKRE